MFSNSIAINEFQLGLFEKMILAIDDASLFAPGLGHGHSPVWILGHLAICADLGRMTFGKKPRNIAWMRQFGPGSNDQVAPDSSLTKPARSEPNRDG